MFTVQGLVWAIRTPAGHLIYVWKEQITRYIISCLSHENHRLDSLPKICWIWISCERIKLKKKRNEEKWDLWHSCSAYFPSYDFLCVFVVSSLQRKDWTMNASSVVSHSTHQRSFNATWLSTALRAWEEPSSVQSALQVGIVHVFVCMRELCIPDLQPNELIQRFKGRVDFYVHVNLSETFTLSMCKALHFHTVFIFSVKRQMDSKWVGKGQASRSAKAESSLLHVAFYLVKLPPNQGQRSVMRWEGGEKESRGEDSVSWGEMGDGGVGKEKEMC